MMKHRDFLGCVLIGAACALCMTACEEQGPFEKAGEKVDDAADKAGDAIKDAGEEIKDGAEDAKDEVDG